MRLRYALIAIAFSCALAPAAALASPHLSGADKRFIAIYSAEWKWRVAQDGGDASDVAPLGDVSPAAQARRLAYWQEIEVRLAKLRTDRLSAENQVKFAVYKAQIDALVAAQTFHEYEKPVNSDGSFWGDLTYITRRERIVGRWISAVWVATASAVGGVDLQPADAHAAVMDGRTILSLSEGLQLRRVRVMGANRIELSGFADGMRDRLKVYGLFHEMISWKLRMFVPTSADGIEVLA